MVNSSRRNFFKTILALLPLGLFYFYKKLNPIKINNETQTDFASSDRLSILQGATSDTETQISICFSNALKLNISIKDSSKNFVIQPTSITSQNILFDEYIVANSTHNFLTLTISQLSPNEIYELIIQDLQGNNLDYRYFKTLDVKATEANCALISCAHDRHANIQENMWKAVETSKPDVLFLLGDNVYIDWPEKLPPSKQVDKMHLWDRTIQIRNLFYLYKMPNLIPTFAIWDDHDTGTNDSYKDSPLMEEAAEVFNVAFPRNEIKSILQRTSGIGYHLKLFGLEIMMMDCHTFRTLKSDRNPTHWGIAQEKKIEEILKTPSSPVWIMNGSQFFGGYRVGKESYEGIHTSNFEKWFLELIKKSSQPVLLTSGDIHYSEIQKIESEIVGYPLYEITSSSIHSKKKYLTSPDNLKPDETIELIETNIKNRRIAATGEFNFILTKINTTSDSISVVATSIGLNSKEYFTSEFLVSKNIN